MATLPSVTPQYLADKLTKTPHLVLPVDARPPFYYKREHIGGAINVYEVDSNVTLQTLHFLDEEQSKVFASRGNKEIILYDDTSAEDLTKPDGRLGRLFEILKNANIQTKILEGGIKQFQGLAKEKVAEAPKPVYVKPPPIVSSI